MKKILSILLAALMVFALAAAVAEDAIPQPEAGKKFEGSWALMGGIIEVYYEEEGYRVLVDLRNGEGDGGTIYEYSCYYVESSDSLVSVSTTKRTYTLDPVSQDEISGDVEYQGIDEAGQETVFAIDDTGALTWNSGREGESGGADLQFRPIGRFSGAWRSAEGEEPVTVDFTWKGLEEETYFYEVYLHRGDDTTYSEFVMTGVYDEETGKLVCTGKSVDQADPETYEAFFSMTEDGKLLYEAANGIVLEYDPLGGSQG